MLGRGLLILLCAACGAKSGLLVDERTRDAAADAQVDAGRDAAVDAGEDAGEDAGTDAGVDASTPGCGNGLVEPGEQCDEGDRNADVPALRVRQGDREWLPQPIGTTTAPIAFYDYRSESAHTGYERPQRANLFVYRDWDRDESFLFFIFSQDDGGFDGTAEIDLEGLGPRPVLLGDEGNELALAPDGRVLGRYGWFSNSDGGIVALPCPGTTTVTLGATSFIDEWLWTGADDPVDLDRDEPVEITCAAVPAGCRTDCRVPACGDGRLDPGEDCDRAGDCPADCDLP